MKIKLFLILTIMSVLSLNLSAQIEQQKGKNPIIIIPGILGSKLVNKKTKEVAWVKFSEAKPDSLKLPISANLAANRDNLEATDIVEKVKFIKFLSVVSVYKDLLEYLEKKVGYSRGNWKLPQADGDHDTYYVFAYDWRLDNVENARLLIENIEKLKAKLKKPDLKFDVLTHSMGGLIARYAAMYGKTNLTNKPAPNWSGAKHFDKIFLLGTPNEGAMSALEALNEGYVISSIAGKIQPKFLNREVTFTIPALFELLPHGISSRFYDENLKPLLLDIYDVKTWRKYGWTIASDEEFLKKLSKVKRVQFEKYLEAVLLRTKSFHQALDVKTKVPVALTFYLFGSDCESTLDGAILYFDAEKDRWKTLMRGDSFKTSSGVKVPEDLVKQTIFGKGDGDVTKSSLFAENISQNNGQSLFSVEAGSMNQTIVCENHTKIPINKTVEEALTAILTSKILKQ